MENYNKNERMSNFELLKIISIIFVLFHHFYYNNFELDYTNIKINQIIIQILSAFGKVGINCFVLITGYFMVKSKKKIKKIILLWSEILFYSFSITFFYIIFINKGLNNINIKDIIKCIMPINQEHYWFMTAYIILYVISGFINKLIYKLTQSEFLKLILILGIIWVISPSFIFAKIGLSNIDWFIFLYLIGGYIRLYPIHLLDSNIKFVHTALSMLVLASILLIILLNIFYKKIQFDPLRFSLPMNQIIPFGISILLFSIFKNLKIKNSRIINKVSSCSLGIYLIHTHILIRNFIWIRTFKVNQYVNSNYLVLYELATVSTVFVVCMIIDIIRKNTVEKILSKVIDNIYRKTSNLQ